MDLLTQRFVMAAAGAAGAGDNGWYMTYGGSGAEYARGIVTDSVGNFYVPVWSMTYDSTYGGGGVAKFDSDGALLWQSKFTRSTTTVFPYKVAVDSSDDVYLAGYSTAISGPDYMLLKYDSSGTFQWQRYIGSGSGYDDQANNITISGSDIYLPGKMFPNITSGTDPALVKYNTSGTLQWQRTIAETIGQGQFYGAEVYASTGDIFVVGVYPGGGLWHLKYNSSGTIQYQRRLTTTNTFGRGMGVDQSNGDYYVSGRGSSGQALVAKYNSSGTLQWQRELATGGEWFSLRLDTSEGMLYVAGGATVAKYSTSGTLQWERTFTLSNGPDFYELDIKSPDHIYIAGTTNSTGAGNRDVIIFKYPKTGSVTGTFGVVTISAGASTASTSTHTDSSTSLSGSTSSMSSGTLNLTIDTGSLTASSTTSL